MKSTYEALIDLRRFTICRVWWSYVLLLLGLASYAVAQTDVSSGFFPGAINIYAGTGGATASVTNGDSPTNDPIGRPTAVAVDSEGDVFFANSTYQIYMVYAGGSVPPILAAVTTKASTPVTPVEGGIYNVANTNSGPYNSGCSSSGVTAAKAYFTSISAIWLDANDNLYIADSGCYTVSEIDHATAAAHIIAGQVGKEGTSSTNAKTNGQSPTSINLGQITDVKTDAYGNVYIVDGNTNAVVYAIYMTSATAPPPVLTAEGVTPVQGDIYIIAGSMDNYCGPSPSSPCYQDAPAKSTILSEPQSVFVDTAGNVYITDNWEDVLDIIYVGEVNGAVPPVLVNAGYNSPTVSDIYIVAGTYNKTAVKACTVKPCGDGGLATAAYFKTPYDVLVDSAGNVYIADYGDNAVRKIDTSGYISTIAGIDNPSSPTAKPATLTADGTAATRAILYHPSAIAFDSTQSNLYIADYNDVVWQVAAATPQTITFPTLTSPVTYSATPITLDATVPSGLPVTYTVSSTSPATVSGTSASGALNMTGAGTIAVTAAQAGGTVTSSGTTTYYAPATSLTQDVTVNKASLTVTADSLHMIYESSVPTLTYTTSGWISSSDQSSSTVVTGTPTLSTTASSTKDSGTYPITIDCSSMVSSDYTFNCANGTMTITGATKQAITFPALSSLATYGQTKTVALSAASYSGTTPTGLAITYTVISGPGAISGSTLTITGAGTIVVQASQNGNDIYAGATPVQQSLVVNPAPLTVVAPSLSLPYGTNITTELAATAPTITGWVGTDRSSLVSGSPKYATSASSTSDPGSFTLSVAQGTLAVASAEASNYTFTNFVSGTITITKASQTISYVAPTSITYGDYPTVTASANSNTTSATSGLAVTVTATGALTLTSSSGTTFDFNASGAGTATITLTQAGNADYAATTPVVLNYTIKQAPLDITATSYTREQGAANPTFAYTIGTTTAGAVGGFMNSDTDIPSVVSGVPVLTTTATQASPQGTYTIAVDTSTMTSTNYTFVPINGKLTVTQSGTYAITANPSSLTIQRGLSAQSTITITPSNEYQGTITLTCGTLPANVTCTVSPSTYTFTGEYVSNGYTYAENPQTGTITINTTSATVAGALPAHDSNLRLAGFFIPGALAGLFLVFARKRIAKRSAIWSLCALFMLGAGALAITSCSGSVNTVAAPGTQTITLTGTGTTPSGGTVTATIPLSITIQ
jgi:hypothetical protein